MAKYRLIERKVTPFGNSKEIQKFYATPVTDRALDVRQFAKLATTDASLAPGEMLSALELFGQTALQQLLQGHSVEIPGIGTLRISFSSEGVDNPEDFKARTMISKPRIIFRPKPDVKNAIEEGMYYENAGVRADGVDYPSIAAYKKAKGEDDAPGSGNGGGSTNPGPLE